MTRALRRRHVVLWAVLGPIAAAVLAVALRVHTPARSGSPAPTAGGSAAETPR